MTQITQFALVVIGVGIASVIASLKGSAKWLLLIVGAFVAWIVLPTVILNGKWGYYQEDGAAMAGGSVPTFHESKEANSKWAVDLATEVCGDAEGFDTRDHSLQAVAMPERAMVEHLFYYSSYSNVIWRGLGWKDRYCLARYLVVDRRDAYLVLASNTALSVPFRSTGARHKEAGRASSRPPAASAQGAGRRAFAAPGPMRNRRARKG